MTDVARNPAHPSGIAAAPAGHAECQAQLAALLTQVPSLTFACLSLVDGRPFAHAGANQALIAPRIAAMTSSLLALSESFAKEALRSRCTYSTLSTEHGTIVIVRVPERSRTFTLSVGADSTESMAMALRMTLDTAARLALILDGRT